jgi:hypothetical protein
VRLTKSDRENPDRRLPKQHERFDGKRVRQRDLESKPSIRLNRPVFDDQPRDTAEIAEIARNGDAAAFKCNCGDPQIHPAYVQF